MRELPDAFNSAVDTPVTALETGRRPGDVTGACTRTDRAAQLLNWRTHTIAEGIRHSLQWAAMREDVLGG